jgi:hypothetical protein
VKFVDLEPVEDALRDRLDQIAGLESRLLAGVATDEAGALEHDVVELAARLVGADAADERAVPEPLTPDNGIAGARRSHDDVTRRRLLAGAGRLAVVVVAERRQALAVTTGDGGTPEPRQGLAESGDQPGGLPAAADQPQAAGPRTGEPPSCDRDRGAGASLRQSSSLDHGLEPGPVEPEEEQHGGRPRAGADDGRQTREAELAVEAGRRAVVPLGKREADPGSGLDDPPVDPKEHAASTAALAASGLRSSLTSAPLR